MRVLFLYRNGALRVEEGWSVDAVKGAHYEHVEAIPLALVRPVADPQWLHDDCPMTFTERRFRVIRRDPTDPTWPLIYEEGP